MHVGMMHVHIYDAANFVTDEPTNEQGDSRSWIEFDLRKFSNGPFSETKKGFGVIPTRHYFIPMP